jgi:hypothetical protein
MKIQLLYVEISPLKFTIDKGVYLFCNSFHLILFGTVRFYFENTSHSIGDQIYIIIFSLLITEAIKFSFIFA